ncbi:Gmad2 immunoglobulin-like domain-containing protein [Marinoscillum furvescens]|uniref:Immunoglobulin-like protein involved in spore germination n=1 Tax=Marinoscillum furvescens DSM 4134 TaxID=1122208 RepID=A0A3D9KY79_MARFU|nr:Gmad2 immunoglobulin-like domain-containing protein [Marinoscillum furvescens]RED92322.1 immunoglobulin-like protein involved in spore germination [Marinoscillum furvescens DSM 4134]
MPLLGPRHSQNLFLTCCVLSACIDYHFLALIGLSISCGPKNATNNHTSPTNPDLSSRPAHRFPEGLELSTPLPGDTIEFPLIVTGRAKGYWYFEGDFQLALYQGDQLLAESYVSALDAWMTPSFVAFEGEINPRQTVPSATQLTLLLQGANPSGLKQNERQFEVPLVSE